MKTIEKSDLNKDLAKYLLDNKNIFVRRDNGIIRHIKIFENKDDLIDYIKINFDEGNDWSVFYTGEDAYLTACNNKYHGYLDDFLFDLEQIETIPLDINEHLKSLLSYDEITSVISRDYFIDAIYEVNTMKIFCEVDKNKATKGSFTFNENQGPVQYEIYPF